MLQDVLRGAQTEIDAINGAVASCGKRSGVPTPVNLALWRAVKNLGGRSADDDTDRLLSELLDVIDAA
jgi:ketopantoate reductase